MSDKSKEWLLKEQKARAIRHQKKYDDAEKRGIDDYFRGIRFPCQCPYKEKRLCNAWGVGQVKARMCEMDSDLQAPNDHEMDVMLTIFNEIYSTEWDRAADAHPTRKPASDESADDLATRASIKGILYYWGNR